MDLSDTGQLIDLIRRRHHIGHLLGSVERREPILLASPHDEDGALIVPHENLPHGFESWIRQKATEIDDEIRMLGVNPDEPIIPEVDLGEDDEDMPEAAE